MTENTYTQPTLWLYLVYRTNGIGTDWIEAHIVKEVYDNYRGSMRVNAVDGYDFTPDEYNYKVTRHFKCWNPHLQYFSHDGQAYNHVELQYENGGSFTEVERMFKTLKSFESAFNKIKEQRGRTVDFVETIMRFGEVCKVAGIIIPDDNYDHNNEYTTYPMSSGRWAIVEFFKAHGFTKGWIDNNS